MKQISNILPISLLFVLLFFTVRVHGQTTPEQPAHQANDTALVPKHVQDSLQIEELLVKIQEMKLNEIVLENKLTHQNKESAKNDSLKKDKQKKQIDSLRHITPGTPLVVEGDTLFQLYTRRGGVMPSDRVEKAQDVIIRLGKQLTMNTDSVYIYESEHVTDIMSGEKVIISFTDQDGLWQNKSRQELARQYQPLISQTIDKLHEKYGLQQKIKDVLLIVLVIVAQIVLIYLTNRIFRTLKKHIRTFAHTRLKPITIKDYEFLNTSKQEHILINLSTILKYVILVLQLMISISILFSIFPETEKFVYLLLSYIWNPAKEMLNSFIKFIPSLFKIVLIFILFKYIIKGMKYIATEIATEKLKINGFFPDWAYPTYYILRFLFYSFMIIMIWPLLPNSNSPVFQGVSVFIGLIFSLGSTTVIGNLMAGLVITYMRPFRIGDHIKLNETEGNVIEKTPFVTRIRTSKNEVVTIPNSFVLSSKTINYSTSAADQGVIIHSDITVGYEIDRTQVQELLLDAARQTQGVQAEPQPFVLVKELADFYCRYQINAYTKQDKAMPKVYSELHKNIIDKFNEAGIEIMSPHFYGQRDASEMMMPSRYKKNKGENEAKK